MDVGVLTAESEFQQEFKEFIFALVIIASFENFLFPRLNILSTFIAKQCLLNMKSITVDSPLEIRKMGWRIWYFQNLLLLIPLLPLIVNFQGINNYSLGLYSGIWDIGTFINVIFYSAFFLDLFAVLLICIGIVLELIFRWKEERYSFLVFLVPFLGILWIFISLLWRFSFYLQGPFNFGFGIRRSVFSLEDSVYVELLQNSPTTFLLISNSIILLLFLLFHDNFLLFKRREPLLKQGVAVDLGTLFGLANCFSNFLIFIIAISGLKIDQFPNFPLVQFLLLLTCWIAQLLIVPLLGMRTARRYTACLGMTVSYDGSSASVSNYTAKFILWLKNRTRICQSVKMRPSRSITGFIVVLILLLFSQPISPFFLPNAFPSPYIEGPYIIRDATIANMGILQYVENLPLVEITGISDTGGGLDKLHLMTNSTMNSFLKRITKKPSLPIGRFRGSSYYYYFKWSVSLIESPRKSPVFSLFWKKVSTYGPDILIWWDNGTRIRISNIRGFGYNYNSPIKWIFLGKFHYEQFSGPMSGHIIRASQLIFLNEALEVICFAFSQTHYVA